MTADDRDLAERQARDVAAFTHGIIDGLGCATCNGTGQVQALPYTRAGGPYVDCPDCTDLPPEPM